MNVNKGRMRGVGEGKGETVVSDKIGHSSSLKRKRVRVVVREQQFYSARHIVQDCQSTTGRTFVGQ